MIKFNNIEIRFGDFTAIRDLSLEVEEGEFFTFLGPSGCGKTTTLRALVGFITPARGTIEVNGEDITYKPIEKRGIGMVFQSYALFPTMTVEENITFGLKENKWEKRAIAEQLKKVTNMVNLTEEQLKKNVSALSGGQQQRVAIARALALNPKIIVLDEPLSNLDAKLRKSLRVELKKIQKSSNTTMIYVTHDQEEALTLSDRIAVFNNGCIEQVGTPREVYYSPQSEFVTNFIGDTNRLSEEIIQEINRQNPGADLNPKD
ncbi:MAG TPA: ABC transporter ATP-binding protein, partial [Sellimonas intestinalis]|nr:ABC transporter ATP-binding protein [Sellimonas intestinalis]